MTILFCAMDAGVAAATMRARAEEVRPFVLADDATEALGRLRGERPSVVVVGGRTASEVAASCRRLRAVADAFDAVIVAVAARPDDVHDLLAAGADDFFLAADGPDLLWSRLVVAERAAAREAWRTRAEGLAATLDSIGDGVVTTDATGAVVHLNPAAEAIVGWSVAEARGRPIAAVMPLVAAGSGAAVASPVTRTLRDGLVTSLPADTLLVRRDGRAVPIADSCAPIRVAGGATRGAVIVCRDLSAQRDAEARRATLRQRVAAADRAASVGILAASVAQGINNPLSYAAANVELALDRLRARPGQAASTRANDLAEMLVAAREGVARVGQIVRRLKTPPDPQAASAGTVDLTAVLEASVAAAFYEVGASTRLRLEYGWLPLVAGDDVQLGQVFRNLLVNSASPLAEAAAEAHEVHVVSFTDEAGWAVVEIRDTGPGVPSALLDHVFDPLLHQHPALVGWSLGLAISRRVVSDLGGRLSVANLRPRGTSFRVLLPPAAVAGDAPVRADETVPLKVLVVDDEALIGRTIVRVLRPHRGTAVTSGQDALDLLDGGEDFDVVLSDLAMPGMTGMELYAALLARHPHLAPRVVFMSGASFTPEARDFLHRVDNEWLDKPFDIAHLRDTIRRVAR